MTYSEHQTSTKYPDVSHDLYPAKRNQLILETLAWLDKYLGPVN